MLVSNFKGCEMVRIGTQDFRLSEQDTLTRRALMDMPVSGFINTAEEKIAIVKIEQSSEQRVIIK